MTFCSWLVILRHHVVLLSLPLNHLRSCSVHSRTVRGSAASRRIWSAEEDEAIRKLVEKNGTSSWTLIAEKLAQADQTNNQSRSGKQCWERWHNHLGGLLQNCTGRGGGLRGLEENRTNRETRGGERKIELLLEITRKLSSPASFLAIGNLSLFK